MSTTISNQQSSTSHVSENCTAPASSMAAAILAACAVLRGSTCDARVTGQQLEFDPHQLESPHSPGRGEGGAHAGDVTHRHACVNTQICVCTHTDMRVYTHRYECVHTHKHDAAHARLCTNGVTRAHSVTKLHRATGVHVQRQQQPAVE